MAKQLLNTGTQPNDGTGDGLRTGGLKVNNNFNEIYSLLGDGENLLNTDIDFGPNKLLFSNQVDTVANLSTINVNSYEGLVVHVEATGALYYAHAGRWHKLLSDNSANNVTNYTDSLKRVAYTGDYNDLSNRPTVPTGLTDLNIVDGSAGQVLTTDGTGQYTFRDVTASSVEFGNITNRPTTLAGYGIQDAFSGDYNDLTNQPVIFSGNYNDLTNKPTIPSDISNLTDTTGLLFDGTYTSLVGAPIIPSDVSDLTDDTNLLFSGSYADLTNKPTSFSSLTSLSMAFGVNVDEFSNDATLADASQTSLVTEFAVKSYVDTKVLNAGIALDDLGVVVNSAGTAGLTYNNATGIFTYTPPDLTSYATVASIPTALSELTNDVGFITAETDSQTLSLIGTQLSISNGNTVDLATIVGDTVGNFTLAASVIDTDDSSAITITPAVVMSSDLTVENNLTVNGTVTATNFVSTGTGQPSIDSATTFTITAVDGVEIVANTTVSGNIIPSADIAYDLGSATNRFRDLYLSGNTIYLGSSVITSNVSGQLALPPGTSIPGVASEKWIPDSIIDGRQGGATFYNEGDPVAAGSVIIDQLTYLNATGLQNPNHIPTVYTATIDGSGFITDIVIDTAYHFEALDGDSYTNSIVASDNMIAIDPGIDINDPVAIAASSQVVILAAGVASVPDTVLAPQTNIPGYLSIAQLKSIVAASTDFADFQSRIAAL